MRNQRCESSWSGLLHHSRFPHCPSVLQSVSLTLLYIVKILSGSGSYIFLVDFHCLQVLDPEKANFVWKHVSKPPCQLLVVENKQRIKQLIDCAKPGDVHLPFQQFFLLPFWFMQRHFNQSFGWAMVNFSISFSIKPAPGMSTSGIRSTWSFAMLVLLNLPRGLLSLTSLQLPFFSAIGVLQY